MIYAATASNQHLVPNFKTAIDRKGLFLKKKKFFMNLL